MKKTTHKCSFGWLTLIPVLLLIVQSPLTVAADTDFSKWLCKLCVVYDGWYGDLNFGIGYASDDSRRFGDYRGVEEEGVTTALDGDLHYRNPEGRYFDLYIRDLGLDSRQVEMRGGTRGQYELRLAWNEIPKYRGYGTQTPFNGVGSDQLTLPADWVPSFNTSGMTSLHSSLADTPLKTQRKTLDIGLTWKFSRQWVYQIDYQHQQKNGSRAFGGGIFFSNATIFPAPVDFTTDQFDMGLSWNGSRGHVRLGFIGSYFANGARSVAWQNPFTASPGTESLRAALEPGNEYYQLSLTSAFALSSRLRLSGQAAFGRLRQDEPFIPYSINPAYSSLPLPRVSLGGESDTRTLTLAGKLSVRLNRGLSFTARVKRNERDNKTPLDLYTPVTTDLFPARARYNRPYSFKRDRLSADLRFRAHRVVRFSGGARKEDIDRTLQAISRSTETTWWGEAKFNLPMMTQLRFRLESSQRDVSDYNQPDDGGPVDHPLMRKFNQADRDRNHARIDLDFSPLQALSINFSYFKASADYQKSQIGLLASKDQSYTVNLSYAPGSRVNAYAFLTRDEMDADIVAATGANAVPWNAVTRDLITTAGMGLSASLSDKASIGFDFVSSTAKGDISVQARGDEKPFKPLRTDLTSATLYFDYEVNEHWGCKLSAEYEKYASQDWALDGLGVDGIDSILTMGLQSPVYSAWYLRVQANYRF